VDSIPYLTNILWDRKSRSSLCRKNTTTISCVPTRSDSLLSWLGCYKCRRVIRRIRDHRYGDDRLVHVRSEMKFLIDVCSTAAAAAAVVRTRFFLKIRSIFVDRGVGDARSYLRCRLLGNRTSWIRTGKLRDTRSTDEAFRSVNSRLVWGGKDRAFDRGPVPKNKKPKLVVVSGAREGVVHTTVTGNAFSIKKKRPPPTYYDDEPKLPPRHLPIIIKMR